MDREDVGDRGRLLEDAFDDAQIGRRVLGRLVHDDRAPRDVEDFLRAMTVGAIDQHQDFAAGGDKRRQHRLDGERSGALHRNRDEVRIRVHDFRQARQDFAIDAQEIRIARTPVVNHDLLDAAAGRQRPGGQQKRVTGLGSRATGARSTAAYLRCARRHSEASDYFTNYHKFGQIYHVLGVAERRDRTSRV